MSNELNKSPRCDVKVEDGAEVIVKTEKYLEFDECQSGGVINGYNNPGNVATNDVNRPVRSEVKEEVGDKEEVIIKKENSVELDESQSDDVISGSESSENVTRAASEFNNLNNYQNIHYKDITSSNAIAAQVLSALQPLFLSLTSEIQSLRNEVQSLKKENENVEKIHVMPKTPFSVMEDFLHFEDSIQEDIVLFNAFKEELLTVPKAPNFIKNCWRNIFKDELAEHLCWKGTEDKMSVRDLTTGQAIKNAAISLGLSEEEYIKHTKTFFQLAKHRHKTTMQRVQNNI